MTMAFEADTVTYSDMRQELATHMEQCAKFGKRFQIVRNGKPEAILLSVTEWEQILETLAIITDQKMMEQLIRSEKDIRKGKVRKVDDVFKDLLEEG